MKRVQFVDHKGYRILRMDFKNATIEDYHNILDESQEIIRSQPEHSILTMAVSADHMPLATDKDRFVSYLKGNKKHVKAAAVASVSGLRAILMRSFLALSGRQMGVFAEEEEAKELLIGQGKQF